jgi:hypothetical protein
MQLHLPKPLHGWRELAGEVGIIVLGVLIALAGEQAVSEMHSRRDAAHLRRALNSELADNRARWDAMRSQDACAQKRLDALDHWLATAPAGARNDDGYDVEIFNMHSSAWDVAKSDSAIAHIPLDERLAYASLYSTIENWRGVLGDEKTNGEELTDLLATADDPQSRQKIRLHLLSAHNGLNERIKNYTFLFTRFDELGIKPDTRGVPYKIDANALCQPLHDTGLM